MMARFIPKEKLSKKAQKELNRQRRTTWDFSPVTKTVESRKLYNRKKKTHGRYDEDQYGMGFLFDYVLDLPTVFSKKLLSDKTGASPVPGTTVQRRDFH